MNAVVAGLLGVHGVIHLLGFFAAFVVARVPELKLTITRPMGVLWLIASALFVTSAVLVVGAPRLWWVTAAAGLVLSQWLIVAVWKDAKYGSLINLALVLPVGVALMANLPGSLHAQYRAALAEPVPAPAVRVVTEADLAPLPAPVQTWLRRAGTVGRPVTDHVHATFRGRIRSKADGPWMPFTATQDDWFGARRRLFFMEASMAGIPFDAYHRFAGGEASMRVRAAGIAQMVDAKGPELSQSETVTVLNDMCVLAPSSVLRPEVTWEPIDAQHARVVLHAEATVSGVLTFDAAGDLVDFRSDDRYQTEDGLTHRRFPWTTPLSDHRDFGGVRLPRKGDARWLMPDGELTYGTFELTGLSVDGR